jgi:hypothetical protein
MKKNGLTTAEHEMLGGMIEPFREFLLKVSCDKIQHVYGKTSREFKAFIKAAHALDSLKCTMDGAACRENHPCPTRLYYGRGAISGLQPLQSASSSPEPPSGHG